VADASLLTPEVVDRLLYLTARAPSPHNAQGWRIAVDGATFRVLRDERRRVLRELDPDAREGDLACGAAVANLCAAAQALGFDASVRWRPEAVVAADVTLSAGSAPPDPARLAVIRDRTTNRSAYRDEPVPGSVLDGLCATARDASFELAIATTPEAISEIADVASSAGTLKLSHPPTQRELHELMRFSPRASGRSRDGLDLELFGVPALAARVSSLLLAPRVLGALASLGVPAKLARDAEGAPIRSSPAVALLYADGLEDETFLRGGACFERLALQITEHGLALAQHSAPIELGLARPAALDASVPGDWHAQIAALHDRLLTAFGCPPGAVPIALFRVGAPTTRPARRSLRVHPSEPPPAAPFYDELTTRNQPAISPDEQRALRGLRVLFAGCGSIGGAPVEPLVRMGLEQLVLAEPGEYEVNNLNRQAARLRDIGRNKADALADLARSINPAVSALVEPTGVTAENVDWLVGTTDVIVDGVDVTEQSGIIAKRLLHEEAWRQRRPVIAGLDLGGTQMVYVFDYRNGRLKPLGGRYRKSPEQLSALDFLSRIVKPLDVPRELLTYTESIVRGSEGSAPQLAPTAMQFGVIAAWSVLDLAAGRTLRSKVRVAIPDLLMPRRRRIANEAARVVQLVRIKVLLESQRVRNRR
jgi:molybdopterin/thiamine biosynthesis adenylyltransferase